VFEERPLDPSLHDRQSFDCGVGELNEYLIRFAEQHRRRGVSTTYVLVDTAEPQTIVGYYTLSAAELDVSQLAVADRKKLPRFPVPCFRMGRLACSSNRRDKGLGRLLLGSAVDRCLRARKEVAAYALIVDAKNEMAKDFYEHFGFTACVDAPMTLYLPLGKSK